MERKKLFHRVSDCGIEDVINKDGQQVQESFVASLERVGVEKERKKSRFGGVLIQC
jgi:hypothetical protein